MEGGESDFESQGDWDEGKSEFIEDRTSHDALDVEDRPTEEIILLAMPIAVSVSMDIETDQTSASEDGTMPSADADVTNQSAKQCRVRRGRCKRKVRRAKPDAVK